MQGLWDYIRVGRFFPMEKKRAPNCECYTEQITHSRLGLNRRRHVQRLHRTLKARHTPSHRFQHRRLTRLQLLQPPLRLVYLQSAHQIRLHSAMRPGHFSIRQLHTILPTRIPNNDGICLAFSTHFLPSIRALIVPSIWVEK